MEQQRKMLLNSVSKDKTELDIVILHTVVTVR